METTKEKLAEPGGLQAGMLSRQELIGDLLYASIYSYFAINDVQDYLYAQTTDIVQYRSPSFGLFTTSLKTNYWFGTPRDVSFDGLIMDVIAW